MAVRVLGRMHPECDDYWDGNWLVSPVSARLGGYAVQIGAALRVDELREFRLGLERLDRRLRGEAVLVSMENWIALTVRCLPNGSLSVAGELDDDMGSGNSLSFAIAGLDQTDIPGMVTALVAIEHAYPVLGRP
ncbi:hypothetical protein E1288_14680 [Saccharopolyspora elongata]|uniref:Uncharacterized protein n=1 Tax=Saccharopolyspora elongata TaxID=2530387 RepID=A0A4R4Z2A2_9PSEU|nr:hypothetical protein E1288_14680 [Saccharopolyspora elongata]